MGRGSMANNRKRSVLNIFTNYLSQFFTIALGVIIPRLVLVNLGSEANGLLSSINNILVYVALLEAGVGAASLQALYKPVGEKDHQSISEILAATDHFYKRTGTVYLGVILLLTFLFPLTIETSIPRRDVMIVVFLSGMPGVIKYYFQGKLTILLKAEGKSYITTSLSSVIHILTSVSKIILLLNGFGIVALQTMYLIFNIVQVVFILAYIRKKYTWLNLKAEPRYDAISQSKNALIHQLSGMVFNNTDVLVLTYFSGLEVVSVYSMYTMLFGMVSTLISNFNGLEFALGQKFNTDRDEYIHLHDMYELFNMILTFSLFCIANIFILPFLSLYTRGVSGISYIDPYLPYLFVATYLMSCGRNSSTMVIQFAGHFKETQYRALTEAIINITVSIVCVSKFGIYGVLIGTIAALFYRTNDMIFYANKILKLPTPKGVLNLENSILKPIKKA